MALNPTHSALPTFPQGTCQACQGITLSGLRDAFRVLTAMDVPRGLRITYPNIMKSSRWCPMCAMIIKEISLRNKFPDFFDSPITMSWWTEYWPRFHRFGPENLKLVDAKIVMIKDEGGSSMFDACGLTLSADEGECYCNPASIHHGSPKRLRSKFFSQEHTPPDGSPRGASRQNDPRKRWRASASGCTLAIWNMKPAP